jgi:alcohol dehydrogenase (cytochrome c)
MRHHPVGPLVCLAVMLLIAPRILVHAQVIQAQVPAAPATPTLPSPPASAPATASAAASDAGAALFQRNCASCHGRDGEGGRGPTLAQPRLSRVADAASLMMLIRRGIEGTEMPASRLSEPELRALAEFVLRLGQQPPAVVEGDAARGATLFDGKGGCRACHAIGGYGGAFGPDLTDVGRRRGPVYLKRALTDPEADVPKGFSMYRADSGLPSNFLQVRVTTGDGRQILGVRVNEDTFSIQLRDASGQLLSFQKSELRELRKDWGRSPMPAYASAFSSQELDDVVAFLIRGSSISSSGSPNGTNGSNSASSASAARTTAGAIAYERIRNAMAAEPRNWLTYSGNYQGHRYSALTQITRDNVSALQPAWIYQSRDTGKIEASPIAVDGLIYITEQPHVVTALDARTGRPVWTTRRPAAQGVPGCCGQVNRGVAILGDTVFTCTFDAHLIALDANTGALRWDVPIVEPGSGHSMTGAPLVVKDKVIVGIAGGEFGIRGFLDAYDAKTGARVWRLWTVPARAPAPGELGGGATWLTGTYDPDLNLLYWGTGNPGSNYNGDDRPGDNLYSNSLLAIDADTGALRWHFQFTPHDLHDWDSNQVPVLIDATIDGRARKLVVQGNRNAFYYVLDRETGELLRGVPYASQTWADGLDPRGRPIVRANTAPTAEGTLVYPGLAGATNWFSPSYSPITRLFYINSNEDYGQTFYKMSTPYAPGQNFEGGGTRNVEGKEFRGVLRALDAVTGALKWKFDAFSAPSAGVLSTAGGLVFSGNREGHFFALDAETGRLLWRFQTGGNIAANPISFEIDGRQHIAIAAGHGLFVFALPSR